MRKISEVFINGVSLEKILEDHKKWTIDSRKGKKMELKNANLSYVDLRGANLRGADLSDSDLRNADLRNTNLKDAYLNNANLNSVKLSNANLGNADLSNASLKFAKLSNADLIGTILMDARLNCADLRGVNLSYAKLNCADLKCANLCSANLSNVDLRNADLKNTNLRDADLSGADLRFANLKNADLRDADLNEISYNHQTSFFAMQCPEKGSFIGYKKADNKIVELLITEDSERSSATTRKCRCSKAKVLSVTDLENTKEYNEVASDYDKNFIYKVGEIIEVKDFNNDRWDECSTGIHFFIVRNEAVMYLN